MELCVQRCIFMRGGGAFVVSLDNWHTPSTNYVWWSYGAATEKPSLHLLDVGRLAHAFPCHAPKVFID